MNLTDELWALELNDKQCTKQMLAINRFVFLEFQGG